MAHAILHIARLTAAIADCITCARGAGYEGPDTAYSLTWLDCETIRDILGFTPTRAEWADAGYAFVGDAHIADERRS
jgi:hypothetical protein